MHRFSLHSFPRAILHVDGDAFFASCEIAKNPALKGKPVVTGLERGIASSMSYEAKALGIKRGMRIFEIKQICPEAIILGSDYESYGLYARRMYEIVRRYTPDVEEYSIDECFADLTGLRRTLRMSYSATAARIKTELESELGMTFSVGLSVNKVTAKIASKWKKPAGLTVLPSRELHSFLAALPIEKVWGIGKNSAFYLNKVGIKSAFDLAIKSDGWAEEMLHKPLRDLRKELRGEFVFLLATQAKREYKSISKTRTFTPPSNSRSFVFSQLSKNVESACAKLRRFGLVAKEVTFFLKTKDLSVSGFKIKFLRAIAVPQDIVSAIREKFENLYNEKLTYRATGVVLSELEPSGVATLDIFGGHARIESFHKIYEEVDRINLKLKGQAVMLGSSLQAVNHFSEGKLDSKNRIVKSFGIPHLGKVR